MDSWLLSQASNLETVGRLQTHWSLAPWATVIGVTVIIALVAACYRYEVTPAGAAYRSTLGLLRLVTVGLILLMLSEAVLSRSRTGKPRLGIVLDRSESMQRADVAAGGAPPVTREEAARRLLLQDDAGLLRRLGREFELQFTEVDAEVRTEPLSADAFAERIAAESNDAHDPSATRLGDAVQRLLEAPGTSPLQGVLLLTDGQSTVGEPLAAASEAARRAGAPLYFVGIGSESPPPLLSMADLSADETVFVDDPVRFQATLKTSGLEGKRVRVELLREGRTTPVASKTITATDDEAGRQIRLVDRIDAAGTFGYRLRASVEGPGTEQVDPAELTHTLVVRDEPISVLLAAGYPNYEYRYLKHLLERDETVRLATHLQEADPDYAASDRTALSRLPQREEDLERYDVLVLIDLDPMLLPRSLWGAVSRFVSRRGGGVALVAGPRSLPAAYRSREAFAALCPTDISTASRGGWDERSGYSVLPTELGRRDPALELADSPGESDRVWRGLPPLYWRAEAGPPKPAARVLAHHPGAALVSGRPAPLIVSHYFGAGRVVLHAFDSSWRWRFRVGDVYFARYWGQTIRRLARGRRAADEAVLVLESTRDRYEPGEPVRLRLSDNRADATSETERRVLLQTRGRVDRTVELSPGAGDGGSFQATLNGLAAGRYRAVFAAGDKTVSAEFEVVAPPGEAANPEMNRAAMTAAAERSRGDFLTLDEADRLVDVLPRARPAMLESLPPVELWNRWPLLAAITGCLTAEWILRKRRSML